ncbi:Peptidyl-prolyl isomerase cwc27 [Homalodisca vitripennis]|nr:Peptidyl-prolyl isomerase cwc27 [Homalodisca vitripennis]
MNTSCCCSKLKLLGDQIYGVFSKSHVLCQSWSHYLSPFVVFPNFKISPGLCSSDVENLFAQCRPGEYPDHLALAKLQGDNINCWTIVSCIFNLQAADWFLTLIITFPESNTELSTDLFTNTSLTRAYCCCMVCSLFRSYVTEAQKSKRSSLYGPLRVARLCVLSILVPGLLLSIPLYMRYNVYIQQAYPVGMSDVRLLDHRISTTWCQRQVVWSNATYNAFLMQEQPEIRPDTVKVSMTRHLVLEDDMKEYWGFYLLRGSTVTVSTCVRWPGASLIMIRGHKHLKQCAYIGDDSSEELDELFEGDGVNNTSLDNDISNIPRTMKKVRDGVVIQDMPEHIDISSVHHHRKQFHASAVEEALRNNWKVDNKKGQNVHLRYAEYMLSPQKTKDNEEYKSNPYVINIPVEEERPKTSGEVYNEMLEQLRRMGPKGRVMLENLNKKLAEEGKTTINVNEMEHSTEPANGQDKTEAQQNISPESSKNTDSKLSKRGLPNRKRRRRNIPTIGKTATQLTVHDEEADNAAEEMEMKPDGEADFRGRINESTTNDQSNSEFWSSFSSSEERLLECEGLLLNLPLTPHHVCEAHRPESILARASSPNTARDRSIGTTEHLSYLPKENVFGGVRLVTMEIG